jgi:hypothetical protein
MCRCLWSNSLLGISPRVVLLDQMVDQCLARMLSSHRTLRAVGPIWDASSSTQLLPRWPRAQRRHCKFTLRRKLPRCASFLEPSCSFKPVSTLSETEVEIRDSRAQMPLVEWALPLSGVCDHDQSTFPI